MNQNGTPWAEVCIFADFLLEYYCDTEQRGLNRVLFINRGHFTGYFLRGSAEMPHRFVEAKREGSGNF